jgi:hypothetical protein
MGPNWESGGHITHRSGDMATLSYATEVRELTHRNTLDAIESVSWCSIAYSASP